MVPASLQGRYVIRFTVTSHYTLDADIERDWAIIGDTATDVLQSVNGDISPEPRPADGLVAATAKEEQQEAQEDGTKGEIIVAEVIIQHKRERLRRRDFGLSLLLSNFYIDESLTSPSTTQHIPSRQVQRDVVKSAAEQRTHVA